MQRGKLCILLAALFFSCQLQPFAQTSDTIRVLSLENAWNEAESHKDVKALAALLAPTFVYTDADGAFSNRSQYLADIPDVTSTQIVNEGMKAESYGENYLLAPWPLHRHLDPPERPVAVRRQPGNSDRSLIAALTSKFNQKRACAKRSMIPGEIRRLHMIIYFTK